MTTALTTAAPKIAKLVAMLSSDKDGEVIATVRAIGRTLKQAGADFHDLAAAVAPPLQQQAAQSTSAWSTGGRQIDAAQLLGIIEAIRKSGACVSANAREFLNSLECKAVSHAIVSLSDKQHKWLIDLATQAARV